MLLLRGLNAKQERTGMIPVFVSPGSQRSDPGCCTAADCTVPGGQASEGALEGAAGADPRKSA